MKGFQLWQIMLDSDYIFNFVVQMHNKILAVTFKIL